MFLDSSFDQAITKELTDRHKNLDLPGVFAELNKHKTSHIIDVTQNLYDAERMLDQRTELEHVVQMFNRPSLIVRDGKIEPSVTETWRELLETHQSKLENVLPGIGRIEVKNYRVDWLGSGFLVNQNLVVTNRHVANHFIAQDGINWRMNKRSNKFITPRIDFVEEFNSPHELEFEFAGVEYIADAGEPDLAILSLEDTPDLPSLTLGVDAMPEMAIAVIGYPWKDSRAAGRLAEAHMRIFNDIYDVKRAAPGKVTLIDGLEFEHDCSTLSGNSGSVCVDLETAEVVGVHYGGEFTNNVAVGVAALRDVI